MGDMWKADDDVHDRVRNLVGQNHPDLALIVDEIVVVFKDKASKGNPVPGVARKVSPMQNVLGGTSYKFMLEIGADVWEQNMTAKEREALLDHLLCACRCEEDPKSGDLKCTIARPDISAYRDNIERYGMWFPKATEEEESLSSKDLLGED